MPKVLVRLGSLNCDLVILKKWVHYEIFFLLKPFRENPPEKHEWPAKVTFKGDPLKFFNPKYVMQGLLHYFFSGLPSQTGPQFLGSACCQQRIVLTEAVNSCLCRVWKQRSPNAGEIREIRVVLLLILMESTYKSLYRNDFLGGTPKCLMIQSTLVRTRSLGWTGQITSL